MTRKSFKSRLWLAALENRVTPATYTVDALTDTGTGTGLIGDLRYCITQAELSPGPDVIDANGVTGTILLSAELPTMTDDLKVYGPGAGLLSIDGQNSVRLLQVSSTGGKQVDFSGITFTKGSTTGNGGVALINNSTATFTNCVLKNSSANIGGLVAGTASSTITIVSCTLSGSTGFAGAGAVYSGGGTMSIRNSTLSGNGTGSEGSGGAVLIGGASAVTVISSTLSGNTAGAHGGAIRTTSGFSGQVIIRNSTITQNTAIWNAGTGRGVSRGGSSGTIFIDSTIVAQNFGGAVNTSDVNGAIQAAYSLFGTTDAAIITGNGNFKGSNASPVDAKLGPLADNGGPTLTHMPADDSPVREAGVDQDAQITDQRGPGFVRLENYATDIGAVETLNYKPIALNIDVVVDEASPNTTFQFTVTYFDKRGSQLVDYSSLGTGDLYVPGPNGYYDVPTFVSAAPGVDAQTIVATYEIPVPVNGNAGWDTSDNGIYALIASPNEVFDKDTTPNAGDTVGFAFLRVEIPVVYTVDEATDFVDGKTGVGEMSLREAISIANTDSEFSKIVFDSSVFNGATTITLSGTELPINDALKIVGPDQPLTIDADAKSRIFNTVGAGTNATIEISQLTISNGYVTEYGGGIKIFDERVVLDHVTVANCVSDFLGGGIYAGFGAKFTEAENATLTVRDCQITGNSAKYYGGGLSCENFGNIEIIRTNLSNNKTESVGGAISLNGPRRFVLVDSAVAGNSAGHAGGGVWVDREIYASVCSIVNSTLSGNVASSPNNKAYGGGIMFDAAFSSLTIANSTITNNFASKNGGAIFNYEGILELQSNIISGNTAGDERDIYAVYYSGPTTITGANNLIGVGDTGKTTLQTGNLTGTKAAPLDAKLAPLANNGGPTMTHALLPGSPALNAGSNTMALAFDQRGSGFLRSVGQTDIGAFEVQVAPSKVTTVQINDGSPQRSRITSVTLTFDTPPQLPGIPGSAFELKRQSDGAIVTLIAVPSGNTVTLTFTGGPVESGSLADGRYTLKALASEILNLDGDGNGTVGDDYELASTPFGSGPPTNIFRIFGDATGDGNVAANDFIVLRQYFNGFIEMLDFDNDGSVSASDFIQFRLRFNGSI